MHQQGLGFATSNHTDGRGLRQQQGLDLLRWMSSWGTWGHCRSLGASSSRKNCLIASSSRRGCASYTERGVNGAIANPITRCCPIHRLEEALNLINRGSTARSNWLVARSVGSGVAAYRPDNNREASSRGSGEVQDDVSQREVMGHIDTIYRSNEPMYADAPRTLSGENAPKIRRTR